MSDSKKRSRSRSDVKTAFVNLNIPPGMSEKEKELFTQAAEATQSSIADLSVEKATQTITAASLANQKALSAIGEEISNKVQLLDKIKDNIAQEKEVMVRLHGAKIIAEHLDVLKAEHDEAVEILNKQIADKRAAWAEEQTLRERQDAEYKDNLNKSRQREAHDYQYSVTAARKSEHDRFAEELRVLRLNEKIKTEELEKSWTNREAELKAREQELVTLRDTAQKMPQLIEAEANKRVGAATSVLKKDHEHELTILKHQMASTNQLHESEKKALLEANARLEKLNVELQTALALAHSKNVEVANKALDATSNQKALDAVQTLIKDQGTNGPVKRS